MTQDDTSTLLRHARDGDDAARQELLGRYRGRLERMVSVRMDRRLAARFDPSDVVQEALLAAHQKLPEYLEERPIAFYPWLRQLAWEHLVKLQLQHFHAKKRSVKREERGLLHLPDHSAMALASRLVAGEASPSAHLAGKEMLARVHDALAELSPQDREILVLRQLEHLSIREIAEVLKITEGAVKVRRLRALARLQDLLDASNNDRENDS